MQVSTFINVDLMRNPVNWVIIPLMWMLMVMLIHWLSVNWTADTAET